MRSIKLKLQEFPLFKFLANQAGEMFQYETKRNTVEIEASDEFLVSFGY